MPRDFDKSKNGLTKLRVAVRGGTIWATYSDEVPPLEDYLGPEILMRLDRLVSRRPLRLLGYSRQIVESNWKLYWENSRDPYHATLLHPFLSTFAILRTDGDYHSVPPPARKSRVSGKSVSSRVDCGGLRINKKKIKLYH